MGPVLAFDVYGTLVDTAGVTGRLREHVGELAAPFARLWRDKQLEYTFRRGLMERYEPFTVCVRDAFDFSAAALGVSLDADSRAALLAAYRKLPLFADVSDCLTQCEDFGAVLYAFSNGPRESIEFLLTSAGIRERFVDIVSVDEVGTFKPSPVVYRHFLARSGADAADAWLISGNPFDVIGAQSAGMRGVWVRRAAEAVFDPWGIEPTLTIPDLAQLVAAIAAKRVAA